MGPVVKLLQAIRGLTKSGAIKSLDDAYRLAQRELGETFSRYQNQIKDAFNQGQKEITKITNKPTADIIPFRKKEGIESLSKGKVKDKGEVIEAVFKPGKDKYGRVVEESPSQASGASPLMKRLSEGAEMLKGMKKSGMDPTVALTKTLARSILNKKGIEIPDRTDPIEALVENFGADVLMDTKNIADELLELQRMGKGTKSIDEVLEQTGMFDIPINKDAHKGISQEQLKQIKKEVDQEKMLEDFDPTDRTENSEGGLNTLMASNDMNERLLEKLYEDFLEQGFSPEEAARKAREAFSERSNAAMGGRIGYKIGSGKSLIKFLRGKDNLIKKIKQSVDDIFTTDDAKYDADVAVDNMFEDLGVDRDMFDQKEVLDAYGIAYDTITRNKGLASGKVPGSKPIKQGDEITSENFGESQFAPDTSGLEKARELAPKMAERFELKQKYPGIDDDLLTAIIDDPDPNNKAQVLGTLEQLMELQRQGKSPEEAVDIIKQTMFKGRKDNSKGGLQYLMGL